MFENWCYDKRDLFKNLSEIDDRALWRNSDRSLAINCSSKKAPMQMFDRLPYAPLVLTHAEGS